MINTLTMESDTALRVEALDSYVYRSDRLFAGAEVAKLDKFTISSDGYQANLPESMPAGEYVWRVRYDGKLHHSQPFTIDGEEERQTSEYASQIDTDDLRQITHDLMLELDHLIDVGWYYNNKLTIPDSVAESMADLRNILRSMRSHNGGQVADIAYLLRRQLFALKSQITRENATARRMGIRTQKIELSPAVIREIRTSIAEELADKLDKEIKGNG